jgi:hypothetical protein
MTHAVLSFVNRIRQAHGLPPARTLEPGMRCREDDCALARTIGGGAVVNTRCTEAFGRRYRHPWRVMLWVWRFDMGKYPELVTLRPTRTGIRHLDFVHDQRAAGLAPSALSAHAS